MQSGQKMPQKHSTSFRILDFKTSTSKCSWPLLSFVLFIHTDRSFSNLVEESVPSFPTFQSPKHDGMQPDVNRVWYSLKKRNSLWSTAKLVMRLPKFYASRVNDESGIYIYRNVRGYITSLMLVKREELTLVDEITVMSKYEQNEWRGSEDITNGKHMIKLRASPNALLIDLLFPESCFSRMIRQVSFVECQIEWWPLLPEGCWYECPPQVCNQYRQFIKQEEHESEAWRSPIQTIGLRS